MRAVLQCRKLRQLLDQQRAGQRHYDTVKSTVKESRNWAYDYNEGDFVYDDNLLKNDTGTHLAGASSRAALQRCSFDFFALLRSACSDYYV